MIGNGMFSTVHFHFLLTIRKNAIVSRYYRVIHGWLIASSALLLSMFTTLYVVQVSI